MRLFGIIGKPLSHSFSKKYFEEKFNREQITDCGYQNFEIERAEDVISVIINNPSLCGLNVTIPFKVSVIDFADELDETANEIGAVNTLKIERTNLSVRDFKIKGYNTDAAGFSLSLESFISHKINGALILGTGGSSKAVAYVLKKKGIDFLFVSRSNKNAKSIIYSDIKEDTLKKFPLLINCTPLGKFPQAELCPPLAYHLLSSRNFLFDLNYNPAETEFLKCGRLQGCAVKNGLQMLHLQAEESWRVWSFNLH